MTATTSSLTPNIPALKLWEKALRSGKYPQAQGRLRTKEGFCCLGVACDLQDKSEWSLQTNGDAIYWHWSDGIIFLQEKSLLFYGIPSHIQYVLTDMNDTGFTFIEIADVIKSIIKDVEDGSYTSDCACEGILRKRYEVGLSGHKVAN